MIIEAKWDKEILKSSVPEATSQAIALSEVTVCSISLPLTSLITVYLAIRLFGIGSKWIFLVYNGDDEGNRISYEGPILTMVQSHSEGEVSEKDVRLGQRNNCVSKNDASCYATRHTDLYIVSKPLALV
jgi:hypothetical protein